MSKPVVMISGDTHLGSNNVDFAPYFDAQYRPQYEDQMRLARRAAKAIAARREAAASEAASQAMTAIMSGDLGTARAVSVSGAMLGMLVDLDEDGSVPYSQRMVTESQAERRSAFETLGIEWDDSEFMSVPHEHDPDLRLKMMELDGVVGSVLFPQVGFLLTMLDPDLTWAGIRAYNRFAGEVAAAHPDRFAATFMLDLTDIDRCCAEARFAKESGLRGGAYTAGGRPSALPPFNNEYYDPLWATLDELELPFQMHGAFGSADGGWQKGPGAAIFNQIWTNYAHLSKGGPLMHFLAGGVFERHPGLKVVVAESGGAYWAAEVCQVLDEIYDSTQVRATIDNMKVLNEHMVDKFKEYPKKPSEYFASNVYVQGHNSQIDWESLESVGEDNVIWSSDFPHAESSWLHSVAGIRANLEKLGTPEAVARKYLGLNAAKLYGFDVEKLQGIAEQVGPTFAFASAPAPA